MVKGRGGSGNNVFNALFNKLVPAAIKVFLGVTRAPLESNARFARD